MPSPVDVVVTDGFTGNVALKTLEGALKFIFATVLSVVGTNDATKAAGDVLFEYLLPMAAELTPENQGGALLLGVDGICVISHGSSNATAIKNALRVASEMDAAEVVQKLRLAIRPDQVNFRAYMPPGSVNSSSHNKGVGNGRRCGSIITG